MATTYVSLEDFAKTRKLETNCWVCNLVHREEIDNGIKAGIPLPAIREWLINELHFLPEEISYNRLRNHMREHLQMKR